MLSTPEYGWCDITIGDWSDRVSYLTNFPIDLLDGILNILKNGKPSVVYCDAEGWEYMLVLDHYAVHIIESKDSYKLYTIEKNIEDLAKECYYDILNNINEWSKWDTDEMTENEIKSNRAKIIRRLKQIRAIYMKRGTFFMIKILGLIALLVSYISFGYYGYSLAEVGNFHFSLVPIVCYLFVFVLGLVTNIVKVRTLNKIKQKGLNNGIEKKDLIKYGKYKEMNFMFNQMFVSVMPFAISTLISVFFSGFKSGLLLLYMAVAVVVAIISKVFDNMTSYDLADIKNRVDYKIKNKDK